MWEVWSTDLWKALNKLWNEQTLVLVPIRYSLVSLWHDRNAYMRSSGLPFPFALGRLFESSILDFSPLPYNGCASVCGLGWSIYSLRFGSTIRNLPTISECLDPDIVSQRWYSHCHYHCHSHTMYNLLHCLIYKNVVHRCVLLILMLLAFPVKFQVFLFFYYHMQTAWTSIYVLYLCLLSRGDIAWSNIQRTLSLVIIVEDGLFLVTHILKTQRLVWLYILGRLCKYRMVFRSSMVFTKTCQVFRLAGERTARRNTWQVLIKNMEDLNNDCLCTWWYGTHAYDTHLCEGCGIVIILQTHALRWHNNRPQDTSLNRLGITW